MNLRRIRNLEKVLIPKRIGGMAFIRPSKDHVKVNFGMVSKEYTIKEYEEAVEHGDIIIDWACINDIPEHDE